MFMSTETGLIQPIDFYREAKNEVLRFLEENPNSRYSELDFDSLLFAQDIQPFAVCVADIEIETVDIDVAKFVNRQGLCPKEEHAQIYFGMTGRFDGEIVNFNNRGKRMGGYLYLLCGGERLPTLVPRNNLLGANPYANGAELDARQCTRFLEILHGLSP